MAEQFRRLYGIGKRKNISQVKRRMVRWLWISRLKYHKVSIWNIRVEKSYIFNLFIRKCFKVLSPLLRLSTTRWGEEHGVNFISVKFLKQKFIKRFLHKCLSYNRWHERLKDFCKCETIKKSIYQPKLVSNAKLIGGLPILCTISALVGSMINKYTLYYSKYGGRGGWCWIYFEQ